MPKISKETYNIIEKKYYTNEIWNKMKEYWKYNPVYDREILPDWNDDFLKEIIDFLDYVYKNEIDNIKSTLTQLESFDDDIVESLIIDECDKLKNKLKRIYKNSTVCDKIKQMIKRRGIQMENKKYISFRLKGNISQIIQILNLLQEFKKRLI